MRVVDRTGREREIMAQHGPQGSFDGIRRLYLGRYPHRLKWFQAWSLHFGLGEPKAAIAASLGMHRSTIGRQIDLTARQVRKIMKAG